MFWKRLKLLSNLNLMYRANANSIDIFSCFKGINSIKKWLTWAKDQLYFSPDAEFPGLLSVNKKTNIFQIKHVRAKAV